VNEVIFENGEGENIHFAKYPALCKRGLSGGEGAFTVINQFI